MPQTPTAGQELHPGSHQPQGAGPAVTQGHESQDIARLWVLHPPPAQFALLPAPHQGTDSLAHPKDKSLALGQPGPLQFVTELP